MTIRYFQGVRLEVTTIAGNTMAAVVICLGASVIEVNGGTRELI